MRKQYNLNIGHGHQLGEKAVFPWSFIEREIRTCPFHLFLGLHLSLFLLVRDILAHCCSPIQKTKKGGVSITVLTKDHATQFLPCPPLAHCAGMFSTVGQSQASQPLAARPWDAISLLTLIRGMTFLSVPVWGGKDGTQGGRWRFQSRPLSRQRWTAHSPPEFDTRKRMNSCLRTVRGGRHYTVIK